MEPNLAPIFRVPVVSSPNVKLSKMVQLPDGVMR